MNRGVFLKHECFEFYECWRVCFLFSTTNYTNLGCVGCFKHECFEFYECWRVCFLFSTTNYTNLGRVGCSHLHLCDSDRFV